MKPQHIDSLQAGVQISVANVYICDRADGESVLEPWALCSRRGGRSAGNPMKGSLSEHVENSHLSAVYKNNAHTAKSCSQHHRNQYTKRK